MNTVSKHNNDSKAKTFSRARAVEILKSQYMNMMLFKKSMDISIERLKDSEDRDLYKSIVHESMGRFETANIMIEAICLGFGIDKNEIDPTQSQAS